MKHKGLNLNKEQGETYWEACITGHLSGSKWMQFLYTQQHFTVVARG